MLYLTLCHLHQGSTAISRKDTPVPKFLSRASLMHLREFEGGWEVSFYIALPSIPGHRLARI